MVKKMDAHSLIQNAAKELKLIKYNLNRCLRSGLDNSVQLQISNSEDMQAYWKKVRAAK